MNQTFDVAIVGYGPVGAVLANLLGRDGVRVQVFERDREIYKLPRAVHFDDEVMRIFQSIGLRDGDLGETAPMLGYQFLNADRELLFDFDLGVTEQGWRPDYMFHQPDLERVLREAVEARESVSVHLEHEVTGLSEQDDHVVLDVGDIRGATDRGGAGGGTSRRVRAKFLIGCDGASSFVRKALGLPLEDLVFEEPWLVVDATVTKSPATLGLPSMPTQLCDPARPITYVPVAGPHIRWEFMLLPGEKKQDLLEPARIESLISEWVDPAEVNVIRSAVYDFHALVAKRWGTRRVFLAGDAAHQTPPFLGQGLCTGIRDVANLAWKLRLVLEDAAPLSLLEHYQSERDPQVRTVIGTAVSMGQIICTLDEEVAAARDADFLSREDRRIEKAPFPPIGPGIHLGDADALAGRSSLQARVKPADAPPALLDDAFGPGFHLILRGPEAPTLSHASQQVLDRVHACVVCIGESLDIDGAYRDWLDRHACDAVLVRPDRVVFGTASGPGAAESLLEALDRRLTGRASAG